MLLVKSVRKTKQHENGKRETKNVEEKPRRSMSNQLRFEQQAVNSVRSLRKAHNDHLVC